MSMGLKLAALAVGLLGATAVLPVSADYPPDAARTSPPPRVASWCRQLIKTDLDGFRRGWVDCLSVASADEVFERFPSPVAPSSVGDEARAAAGEAADAARAAAREKARKAVEAALERAKEARAELNAQASASPASPEQNGCTTEREQREGYTRVATRCVASQVITSSSGSASTSSTQSQTSISIVRSKRAP